jgi:hypothetical protein
MTAVADAAAVNHHHQYLLFQNLLLFHPHLQLLFQYHLHRDVKQDNIKLMEHAYGTLFKYQLMFQIHAHQDSSLMDMEAAFQ